MWRGDSTGLDAVSVDHCHATVPALVRPVSTNDSEAGKIQKSGGRVGFQPGLCDCDDVELVLFDLLMKLEDF